MMQTPLYSFHLQSGAQMVDFFGWQMPLHYGSQLREHLVVRQQCGMFDVSHMGVIDVEGDRAELFLRRLVTGDVTIKTQQGRALYTLLLTQTGGILDDAIIYRLRDGLFRLVVNAGTRNKDLAWIQTHAASFGVTVTERTDLAILAVQGPKALEKLISIFPPSAPLPHIAPFHAQEWDHMLLARTGYTGEDGFELIVQAGRIEKLWNDLLAVGVAPIGLGARDTLRLEAGMSLYGADMDEEVDPYTCGLAWTVDWEPAERNFLGRNAIEPLRLTPPSHHRLGLILEERGVLRNHLAVFRDRDNIGEITSGGYSPNLEKGIALVKIERHVSVGSRCQVEIRGRRMPVKVVRPPFVRHGQRVFKEV
ncbi:MAG: glycine cleavage system aminomethyltransferase GcvT [Magnetococcus sp. DMHC-6]